MPFMDKDSIPAVSTLAEYCKGRIAQAGWTHLSRLDEAQRSCMLDFCAEWGLSFWKQFKIPSFAAEVSSGPDLGRLGVVRGLGSVSLARIGCAGCSLCPCQPLPSAGQ